MAAARLVGAARQFSTSAARAKLVTAPVQVFGIEGRYATALYSAATKEKKLDAVEKELNSFKATIEKDTKLADFVANPTIKKQDKKDVLLKLLEKQKCSNITVNLFSSMAENGRLNRMNGVLDSFGRIMSAHRGEVQCTVTTSKPLDGGQMKELKAALDGFLQKGQALQLETKVDPSLIGGMIVNLGDRYIDMSTASKIKAYTEIIKQAV